MGDSQSKYLPESQWDMTARPNQGHVHVASKSHLCGVRPLFFSTALLTGRAPSTVWLGIGGKDGAAEYLPSDTGVQPRQQHHNSSLSQSFFHLLQQQLTLES